MKKLQVFLGILLSVVLTAAVNNAFAQKKGKPHMKCEDKFTSMDTDKDGKVSLAEFKASKHPGDPDEKFKERDADKDGSLTKDELCSNVGEGKGCKQEMHMKHGEGEAHHMDRFKEMDTDKDGKLTLKEFTAVKHHRDNPEEVFKSKDTDKDGVLTKVEFGSCGHGKDKDKK